MTTLFDPDADLADVVRELPPELGGQMTFHLPLELQALEVAGANRDQVHDRIERRMPAAFGAGLVDPPLFRWAEQRYQSHAQGIVDDDLARRRAAFEGIQGLGPGLAGGAFHALIRTGYGAMRRDAREVARGLAYLRTRRQVLFSGGPGAAPPPRIELPGPEEMSQLSVFDQLDLVAGDEAMAHAELGTGAAELPTVTQLCADALALVRKDPDSFIAVHAVTGLHALVELQNLIGPDELGGVPHDPLLAAWWQAEWHAIRACTVLVNGSSADTPTRPRQELRDVTGLVEASIESCEVHDLKIAVSLTRLHQLGLISEADAVAVGTAKLAATECDH